MGTGMKEWVLRMLEVHDIHEPVFITSIALYKESIQIETCKRKGVQGVHPNKQISLCLLIGSFYETCTSRLATLAAGANIQGKDHTTLRFLLDFSPAFYLGSTARGKGGIVEQCPSSDTDVPATQRGGFSCRDPITRKEMKPERKRSTAQHPLAGDCQYGPEKCSQLVHEFIHRSKLLSEQLLNTSVIITTEERGGQWGGESETFLPCISTTAISHLPVEKRTRSYRELSWYGTCLKSMRS